ncbi:MAG: SusF/SusE family outer membrane protein [Prolixibacteraceae bacterium]|nr:SusF/SusE family outer membrane protein [Prolixibacteraceae bacterium]
MKTQSIKSIFKYALMAFIMTFVAVSCSEDEDDPIDEGPKVLDGLYVVGESTALTELSADGKMNVTLNEVLQEERSTLYEIYIAVEGGGEGFTIQEIAGDSKKTFGPADDFAEVTGEALDIEEPQQGLWKGGYTESETGFVVPEDGLYHVVIDTEVEKVAIAKVVWGLIGGATPGGWSDDTPMSATFNKEKMEFVVEDVTMLENEYKFRYSGGWKIFLDTELDLGDGETGVTANTNFGGSLGSLVPGGDNIANTELAVYKSTMTWELGVGHAAAMEKTGDAEPLPEYPEALYLVGGATAYGWDEPGIHEDALMHKIAGGGDNEGIFWKVLHIAGGDPFKISAEKWLEPNLGFDQVSEFDAEGVEVTADNDGNMLVAESNMYMVVVDLRNDATKVSVTPAEVYGIGDAFLGKDNYNEDDASALFSIDLENKALVSPALTADGNIRMYANHAWIKDWWNAEFNVFDGVIEYRNDGGDQDPVAGTSGQVITLYFDNNTGTIE